MDDYTFETQDKVLDVDDLKIKLLCRPNEASRSVIINMEYKDYIYAPEGPDSAIGVIKNVTSVFGEQNIEDIEIISNKLLLVSLHYGKEHTADQVRSFYCSSSYVDYSVHCMHPISAYIEGKLLGIPRFVASENVQLLAQLLSKTMPNLTNITLNYYTFSSSSDSSGYFRVEAKIADVAIAKLHTQSYKVISFNGFDGHIKFRVVGPFSRRKSPQIPAEKRDNITIQKYW